MRYREVMYEDAYHGSAHRFDAFSLTHVGRGEGNQSYGWGLYFTDSMEVARFYLTSTVDQHHKPKTVFRKGGEEADRYEDVIRWVIGVDSVMSPNGDSVWSDLDGIFKPFAETGDDPDIDYNLMIYNDSLKSFREESEGR